MNLGLKERAAIVGGSSRGMGKATALALAREGAYVTICARTEGDLRSTAMEIARFTSQSHVLAISRDLSQYEDIRRVVRDTLNRFDRIDILVNNIGGPPLGKATELEDESWMEAFEQNFLSATRMSREVVPLMKQQGWGRIINLLSISIRTPEEGLVLSSAIRMAVAGFSKALSDEVAPFNITVNNVLPGYILTDRLRSLTEIRAQQSGRNLEDLMEETAKGVPLGRLGKPEEMGDLIAFIASEKAGYITGTSIPLDGGVLRVTI